MNIIVLPGYMTVKTIVFRDRCEPIKVSEHMYSPYQTKWSSPLHLIDLQNGIPVSQEISYYDATETVNAK